jgi:hypothetical protein
MAVTLFYKVSYVTTSQNARGLLHLRSMKFKLCTKVKDVLQRELISLVLRHNQSFP